jgi:hypothetical protein
MAEVKKSEGFGDTVAKITHAIGADVMAEKIAKAMGKKDCGCKKRQETLNKMFPYKNNQQDGNTTS